MEEDAEAIAAAEAFEEAYAALVKVAQKRGHEFQISAKISSAGYVNLKPLQHTEIHVAIQRNIR